MKRAILFAAALLAYATWAIAQTPAGPSTGTGYPNGAQAFLASATAATTSATVTVAAVPGLTAYICTVSASENAGTASATVGSITNLLGPAGTAVTFSFWYQSGVETAAANAAFTYYFSPCMPAVAANTAVVATTPVATAATASAINVTGYLLRSP